MKVINFIFLFFILGNYSFSQETPVEDDLGNVSDNFQETYYEALKQKGIENYDKAIELLVECSSMEPNNASVYFELGKNYLETDRYNLAEKALETASGLKPNNQWILEEQYFLFRAQGKNDKIQKTLENLVQHHPKYNNFLIKHYIKTKQFNKAIETLDKLDKTIGSNDSYDKLRHQAYIHGKKFQEYADYLTKIVAANNASENNFVNLIFAHTQLKENDLAYKTAILYVERFPNSDKPYLSIYKFELAKGNTAKAIEALHRVTNSTSLLPNEKFKVANDFFKYAQGNPKHMVELDKVVKVFTNQTLINKLTQYYQKNKSDKADELAQAAQENSSDSFQDLKILADILLKGGNHNDAYRTTERALELYPAQPVLYLQQAKALLAINQPKKALNSLELGVDYIVSDSSLVREFYTTMAKAYQALNDTKNQQKYLLKAKKVK